MNFFRKLTSLGVTLTLVFTTVNATAAHAQIAPFAAPKQKAAPAQYKAQPADEGLVGGTSLKETVESDYVILADRVAPGGYPRAAYPGTISEDSPTMGREKFLKYFPELGVEGFERLKASNKRLCIKAAGWMERLGVLKLRVEASGKEYEALAAIYAALPADVKRATYIVQASQVVSGVALCVVSAGAYCIAAAVVSVGNIFMSQSNRKLSLMNIRVTAANIALTQASIDFNLLALDIYTEWVPLFVSNLCIPAGHVQ